MNLSKRIEIRDQIDPDIMDYICGELYLVIENMADYTYTINIECQILKKFDDIRDRIDINLINLIEGVINE